MNLSARSNGNSFFLSNRYLEFGNAIREKYAQFQNQGGAPLLYAEQPAGEEREETPAQTQITNNYYTLRFLQQENVLYQQKLSFLLEVMEKRLQQNVYTTLEKQLEKVIREERTQAKPAEVRLLAEQARALLREGGAEPLEELVRSISREGQTQQEPQKQEQLKRELQKQEQLIRKITNLYNSSQLTQKYQTVRNYYLTQDLRRHQEIHQYLTVHQPRENDQNQQEVYQIRENRQNHREIHLIQENPQEFQPKPVLAERWNSLLTQSPIKVNTTEAKPGRENPTGYIPPHLEYREEEPEVKPQAVHEPSRQPVPEKESQAVRESSSQRLQEERQQAVREPSHQPVPLKEQQRFQPEEREAEHAEQSRTWEAEHREQSETWKEEHAELPGRMDYEAFLKQKQEENARMESGHPADRVSGKAVFANEAFANTANEDGVQENNFFYEPVRLSYQEEAEQPGKSGAEPEGKSVRSESEHIRQHRIHDSDLRGQSGRISYEAFLQQKQGMDVHTQPEALSEAVFTNKVSANTASGYTVLVNKGSSESGKRIISAEQLKSAQEPVQGTYPAHEPAHLSYQEEGKQPEIEQSVRTVIREVLAQQRDPQTVGLPSKEQRGSEAAGPAAEKADSAAAAGSSAERAGNISAGVKIQAEALSGRLVRAVERLAAGSTPRAITPGAGKPEAIMPGVRKTGVIMPGVRKPGVGTITQAQVIGTVLQALTVGGQPGRSEGTRRLEERKTRVVREIQRIFLEAESEPSLSEAIVEERLVKVLLPFREEAALIYQSQEKTAGQAAPHVKPGQILVQAAQNAQPGRMLTQAGRSVQPGRILFQPGKGLAVRFGKEPVLRWEEAPMVYEEDKEQHLRQADGQIRRLTQQTHEVLKEIQVIRNTTVTHEKIIEEQKQIQRIQEKRQKQEKLPAEQMRKAIDQEVYRSMERQLDGSVNRIADKVYQKLESRLKSERSRRGLI